MGLTASERAGDLSADRTLESALAMALLSIALDRITIADLERERLLLGHRALDDVLAAIHATGALDASRERAHRYADSARAALGALAPSNARDALGALADYAVDRTR